MTDYQTVGHVFMAKHLSKYFVCFAFLCLSVPMFLIYAGNLHQMKLYKYKIQGMFKEACYDKTYLNKLEKLEQNTVNESSIFFIESRCHVDNTEEILMKRQACAIESAARSNPNKTVYVLFPSPVPYNLSNATTYIHGLLQIPNIKLRHIPVAEYMEGTPLEAWYMSGALETSHYHVEHASDILRLVTLWKFGGIYLDLDTVTLRSLEEFSTFAVAESPLYISNGVIGSLRSGIGHEVMSKALDIVKDNFRGNSWSGNGPVLVTRVLRSLCNITSKEKTINMTKGRCKGFNIYPSKYFLPLPYYSRNKYFSNGSDIEETKSVINESYTIHLWNKFSHDMPVKIKFKPLYAQLAQRYCPQVYNNSGNEL